MKNELQCEIVQDLLPSYVDGLTSEVTNAAVCGHIDSCEECRKILERMREPQQMDMDVLQREEIDFLKKTKRRLHRRIGISIFAAVFFVAAVLFIKFYCIGSELYGESVKCRAEVSGKRLKVNAEVLNSSLGIARLDIREKGGVVTLSCQATLASPFHKGTKESSYEAENEITQVRFGDRILWDHGVGIQANVSEIFLAKHDYVGEMPANGRSSRALGIADVLGNYKNELQTVNEPYGWKMNMEDAVSAKNQADMEQRMKSYAYILLATIGNLGYVEYEYSVENKQKNLTVTLEEATKFAGQDIKACGKTAAQLQALAEKAGLNEYLQKID
ncbi:MAG: DUF4825 domain-containing protein [Lachnospiraceae bacterium]|nr:DUF4825 domain-containing protein [Lachnospiraceae bacterium]